MVMCEHYTSILPSGVAVCELMNALLYFVYKSMSEKHPAQ